MNREEYMRLLESALNDIPQSEKEEALHFYNDYFDDAGVENEQEVMNSLGSPEELAESIRREFIAGEGKFEGNRDAYESFSSQDTYAGTTESSDGGEKKSKLSGGVIALIVVLAILASPFILTIGAVVLSVIATIFAAVLSVIIAVIAVIIALVCVVAVCIMVAIAIAGISPLSAVVLFGVAFAIVGLSIFLFMAVVWLFGVAIPWMIKGIGRLFKKLFAKKGGNQ